MDELSYRINKPNRPRQLKVFSHLPENIPVKNGRYFLRKTLESNHERQIDAMSHCFSATMSVKIDRERQFKTVSTQFPDKARVADREQSL